MEKDNGTSNGNWDYVGGFRDYNVEQWTLQLSRVYFVNPSADWCFKCTRGVGRYDDPYDKMAMCDLGPLLLNAYSSSTQIRSPTPAHVCL